MILDTYKQLCKSLNKLFDYHTGIEQRYVAASEFKDISVNDMHVIDAVGPKVQKSMSTVAKAVGVTVGTLTIAMNGLVKKGYVVRDRSEKDRRVVLVSLSAKGEAAYSFHQKFYEKMGMILKNDLNEETCSMLDRCIHKILDKHL